MNCGTPKRDRLCVDPRGVNALTKLEFYPLPDLVDTVGLLGQCRIVTVLDMVSGYLQVGIEQRDKEKNCM